MENFLTIATVAFAFVWLGSMIISASLVSRIKQKAPGKLARHWSGRISIKELKEYRDDVSDKKIEGAINRAILLIRINQISVYIFFVLVLVVMALYK